MASSQLLALDVGERRIGVAIADPRVRISVPLETIDVDGNEIERIAYLCQRDNVSRIVVGYPRNQSGEATKQTAFVEDFARQLKFIAPIAFQDESLTSVHATRMLEQSKKRYERGDVDMQAAALILQDYLEEHDRE